MNRLGRAFAVVWGTSMIAFVACSDGELPGDGAIDDVRDATVDASDTSPIDDATVDPDTGERLADAARGTDDGGSLDSGAPGDAGGEGERPAVDGGLDATPTDASEIADA